ncbi:MAG TPA: PIG-L family deacetylase [Terriglobales bacterium]|nr:PIG-L family deacetylase [Terriglobales bacterium]
MLVAHFDDEAAGCGGVLQRMRDPVVVFGTDGAPRDDFFWRRFGSRDAYAAHRRGEARRALAHAGITGWESLRDAAGHDIVDQELLRHLRAAAAQLTRLCRRQGIETILTLAYEGGHPDHDCCSALAAVVGRELRLDVWEMPLYHRSADGVGVRQQFLSGDSGIALQLTAAELDCKRAMWAAYASQGLTLSSFDPAIERLRPQAAYDYTNPPHPGVLNYEAWQWPVTGSEVCAAFADLMGDGHAAREPSVGTHGSPSRTGVR